ncbi:hypothetical protein RHGRI_026784 [Rhododendron griersonianum]|uniref:HMA domain-containing protein n=1 Tax=Rhododendron griersonianum TaxID=479676 RepID=A0AAV6IVF9_9ERIC|nr:hypothetical protein RHGRI_026784 [Rhododendron griersonianum]
MQTVEVKVKMDCEGCEKKVRNAVSSMRGVKSVEVNRKQSKVTVSGYVKPDKVLKRVRRTGKKAELWPYVPYNLVYYPYAHQAYDRKAPAGYVRNVAHPLPAPNSPADNLANMFRVKSVDVNRKQSKVTVSGYVKPDKVLKSVRSTGKKAEFWPYVPYNLVYYPYAPQTYDKKAPAGHVRNVAQPLRSPTVNDRLATMFSEDNTEACSIM